MLDAEGIPKKLLFQNLRELELVNTWLGGLSISLAGFRKTLRKGEKMVLADIGCGGGEVLKAFAKAGRKMNLEAEFIGIDLKADCIEYAEKMCAGYEEVSFACGDYQEETLRRPEVTHLHASLFCHHLRDEQIVELFRFCKDSGKVLIVNDLQRHPLAYAGIWLLTRLLRGSKLVKNDGPLSVLRGFKRRELEALLRKAGIENFSLRWRWAFRYMIIVDHGRD